MFLTALVTTFFVILPVELPDKTLVATLVLSTRYRPVPVLVGVSCAFFVQCAIAVTAGGLLTLLPQRVVLGLVAVLFALGAMILLREHHEDDDVSTRPERTTVRMALASFGVLFAAEWGDASQLATAGLTAKYHDPIAVFLGSWLALVLVATLAVLLGKQIQRRVPLSLIQRVAGVLFAAFAVFAAVEAVRG
ncbi:MAG TPA: TMEM165/GDT1 family protein [Mycobacteriales bacterium]|nr:TMEM165/GDT1 family protein [Mycobacteriales bacterium]